MLGFPFLLEGWGRLSHVGSLFLSFLDGLYPLAASGVEIISENNLQSTLTLNWQCGLGIKRLVMFFFTR